MKAVAHRSLLGANSCFKSIGFALLLSAALRTGLVDGSAQGTVYTDRSLFNAALQSSSTSTFESLTPTPNSSFGLSSVSDGLVSVTSPEGRLFVCNPGGAYLHPIPGDGQYLWQFDGGFPIGISLPNGMNAFGADFSGGITPQNNPFNATLTVNLVGGQSESFNFTGDQGSWTFRGFVFSSPISSLVYDDGGPDVIGFHEEMLDNVTFGVVPEPQALTIALWAVPLWLLYRRRCSPK